MRIYSRDMARSAVKRVLERIEGGALPPVRLEYPIDLIIRESCKEVKKGEAREAGALMKRPEPDNRPRPNLQSSIEDEPASITPMPQSFGCADYTR
jgi:hypothetical protein